MTTAADPGMQVLSEQAGRLGLHLSGDQLGQFSRFTELLQAGNRRANLTAITDPEQVQVRHYLDSLTAVLAIAEWRDGARVVDIGAGAGFPGVPLKIVFPGIRLTLAESVGKKTAFLRELVSELALDDVEAVTVRAEEFGAHRGLSRAVRRCPGSGRGVAGGVG